MNASTDFVVDMSKVGTDIDQSKLTCSIFDPRGNTIPSKLVPGKTDEEYRIMYTPFEAGRHTIELLYDNAHVPGSPFVVHVKSGCDPTRCKAYGPGLERGNTGNPCKFVVETRGAGTGGLSLAIEGPSEAKMTCIDNRDGSCDVEYLPTEPGDYDITIRFADKHIPGSPFKVTVDETVDPSKVKVYGPGVEHGEVREGVKTYFNVDVGEAGPGKIAVNLNNSEGKALDSVRVEDKGDGLYAVHFIPPKEGSVISAKVEFADQEVPCSPFVMTVFPKFDTKKVEVSGDTNKKKLPASLPAKFQIDTKKAGKADINVTIKNPQGKALVPRMDQIEDGTYAVSFIPDECGPYNVSIKYGDNDVVGSPFILQAHPTGEAEKCKIVENAPKVQEFGNKSRVTVDAREAGDGAVTCKIISDTGSDVDIDIIEKDGFFDIFYVLNDPGDYDLDIKFGGKNIPDGTYSVKAVDQVDKSSRLVKKESSSSYFEESSTKFVQHSQSEQLVKKESKPYLNGNSEPTYRPILLDKLPLPTTGGNVVAEVKMPSGRVDQPIIEDNRDGTVRVQYDPREEGIHELAVKYNGEHVQGSPYKFHVDSIASGFVTAYGPGLTHGVTGEPCNFTISTKGAGAGGLSLAVEGPSKAEISYNDNKDGTVGVTYLPTAPGEYKVSVRFGDKNIKGSPFFAKITGEGRKRNQISVGSCSEVTLPGVISDADLRSLNASIQTPSGLEEPCFLKRMPSGNIGISFTPRESKSEKYASKIIEDDNQNIEDVAPAGDVAEAVIDIRNNEDVNLTGVAREADTFSHTVISENRIIDEDTDLHNNENLPAVEAEQNDKDADVSPEVKDNQSNSCCKTNDLVNQNNDFITTDNVLIEVKDDQSNEAMVCDISCDPDNDLANSDIVLPAANGNANIPTVTLEDDFIDESTDGPKNEDLVAPSEITDSQNMTENVIDNTHEVNDNDNDLTNSDIVLPAANGNANVPTVTLEDDFTNEGTDEPKNEDLVAPSEITDSQNMTENVIDNTHEVNDNGLNCSDIVLPAANGNANVPTVTLEDDFTNEGTDEPKNEDLVAPSEITDIQNITENLIDTTHEVKNGCDNKDLARAIDDVTNSTEEQQNKREIEIVDNNDIIEDKSQASCSIPVENSTQIHVNPIEKAMEETIALPQLVPNNSEDEVKSTNSNPKPASSLTSSKNNSGLEMRKKRYRKTVDSNHRKNVQSQLSKSSGCTKVTSTTTVQVTTNDDTVFDALADMPEFVNSSVIDLASSYIERRMRQEKNLRTRFIDFDSALPSSSSSFTKSWRSEKLSSIDDEFISPREAYKQLNNLLKDGTSENLKAVMYDEYNGIRFDDDVASSEDEFLSDIEDLNLTNAHWTPPESELRRQVAIILKKIHPLENNYSNIIDDMLSKYLNYIHQKQRAAKVNRIVDCVNKPVSQQEKTEMLIRREIDDKKLNREFYHSPMEPSDFTELCERRREAIIRKYTRCHNDRKFCYSYFMRSIDDRPVSQVGRKIAKLKQELELIFA
ncbi:hypothetical protein HA402_003073 [Bradysia odoriphaga]|nr:hypothetical protein HA402_003073 [Bradysia odoriphaga]